MTLRRARSIEALGLIVLLWSTGRAGVVYFTGDTVQAPQKHLAGAPSPPMPVKTAATTMALMAAPSAAPQPARISRQAISEQRNVGASVSERQVLANIWSQPPPEISPDAPIANSAARPERADEIRDVASSLPGQTTQRAALGGTWLVWRPDATGQALGAGGQLGGSQAGARLILPFAFENKLRASLRAYAPLNRLEDYEIAPGISVRPVNGLPVELIAERRIRGGPNGDATSLFLAGGTTSQKPGSIWRAEIYGQAGMVGLHKPLLFADGAVSLRRSVGDHHALGGGVWGGIQPGLKRLDVGPSATTMIGPSALNVRLTVDWRVRVAGEARPGSGLSLTVSKDF